MRKVPVLFIVFNRPDTTAKVFAAVREAKPSVLYIAADAPRKNNDSDIDKCRLTREITEQVDWPCTVKRLYQEQNLGCSIGPRTAFNWFFSSEKEGIILEDDCVPHPDFFQFASEMLERFRENKQIISINGSNLGYTFNDESYCFSRFMNMWGWATWADRAATIDYSLTQWKKVKHPLWFLYKQMRQGLFDTDINWYKYWQHKFDLTITKENITWWDWQWIFHQIVHKQISVVPAVNLISNIGFDADATHTHAADNPAANIPVAPMVFPLKHPEKIEADFIYEEHYVKWVWCYHKRLPLLFYIKMFLSGFVKK